MGASGCDGHIADEEVGGLVTALLRMKLYQRFSDKHYNQMLNKLHGTLKRKGVDTLIDACVDALPENLRETAFANACDIVLADGVAKTHGSGTRRSGPGTVTDRPGTDVPQVVGPATVPEPRDESDAGAIVRRGSAAADP